MFVKTLNIAVSRPVRLLLVLVVFLGSIPALKAQSEEDVYAILDPADQKKIDKATEYKTQADQLIEEANQLYMETFSVQADVSLDEKKANKKVAQLELKAQQKQFEALELYRKSNAVKYGIYKEYMEKFWSEHAGEENNLVNARLIEEQSNDLYYQANVTRNDAGKLKERKDKIKKLNDAYDLELRALDKQRTALGIYYNLAPGTAAPSEQVYQPAVQPTYQQPVTAEPQQEVPPVYTPPPVTQTPQLTGTPGAATIDPEMIAMYNRYINDTTTIPEGFLSPEILERINSFNADQILNIWYSYIYSQPYSPEYEDYLAAKSVPETDSAATAAENPENMPEATGEQGITDEQVIAEIHEGEDEKALLIPADENVVYRVQIAADKTQLSQRALRKMYYGQKNVEMINENGWYKYSVGDFDDFQSANKFRKECGVANAFIVAYRKGARFVRPTEEQMAQMAEQRMAPGQASDSNGLLFRVQIAASRINIRREQLEGIYSGSYCVEQVEEEGWYKYQLPAVRLFSDALKMIRDVQVEGSFIAAYDNGIKIDLYDGVKRSIRIEKEVQVYGRRRVLNDTEFFVQIAASKIPISPADLSQICTGNDKLTLMIEDGWYKYRIKAGFDPDEARKIREACGVKDAFIAAYQTGEKTSVSKAISNYK